MKHVTGSMPEGTMERLRARRLDFEPGRVSCHACMDTGLLYATRAPYGRLALGVVPCTECEKGADRHLDGAKCIWARGSKPCSLCGAHEGEQVPAGWTPRPPTGFVAYDELPGWGGDR